MGRRRTLPWGGQDDLDRASGCRGVGVLRLLRYTLVQSGDVGAEFNHPLSVRPSESRTAGELPSNRSGAWLSSSVPDRSSQADDRPRRRGVRRAGASWAVATMGCGLHEHWCRAPRGDGIATSAQELRQGGQRPGVVSERASSPACPGTYQRLADACGLRASGEERRERLRAPRRADLDGWPAHVRRWLPQPLRSARNTPTRRGVGKAPHSRRPLSEERSLARVCGNVSRRGGCE
jgi:hypothetical protein